jgi:hypothetical protein
VAGETAAFLSPENRQTTCVPEATCAAVVMLTTRLGRLLVATNEAVPAPSPVHVRDGVALVSKFTPAKVIVLGVAVVPMVNDTVAVTPAAAAKLLDSTMEENKRTEEITAG